MSKDRRHCLVSTHCRDRLAIWTTGHRMLKEYTAEDYMSPGDGDHVGYEVAGLRTAQIDCGYADPRGPTKEELIFSLSLSDHDVRWKALEWLTKTTYKPATAADVWSFGVTVVEIFSQGALPYSGVKTENIVQYLQSGKRCKLPNNVPDFLRPHVRNCWKRVSVSR